MARQTVNPWVRIGLGAWVLGAEAATVVSLRMMKLAAGGPAAGTEAQRMVSEKVQTALALQTLALSGALGATPQGVAAKSVAHVRRKVRANRRRLLKP